MLAAGLATLASAQSSTGEAVGDDGEVEGPTATEAMTEEEAQKKLDPADDPGLVLHQLDDGSWVEFQISYLGGLPDRVKTSEDFARFDVEQQLKTGELPSDTDVSAQVKEQERQLGCIAEQSLDLEPGEALPLGCAEEPR